MRLTRLQLSNLRSYEELEIALPPGVTVFFGPNASGKTNVLEAIYLAASGGSFRAPSDREVIRHEADFARVAAGVARDGRERELVVLVPRSGAKQIRVAGNPRRRASLIGELGTVLFLPEELELPHRSPGSRRRYLDRLLSGMDPAYLTAWQRLQRVLEQRNRLLKRIRERLASPDELEVWDEQLIPPAEHLAGRRLEVIAALREPLEREYRALSGSVGVLGALYETELDREKYAASLREALRRRHELEIQTGVTGAGPHRDDLLLTLDGRPLAAVASRGEIRTAILALKLAEVELYQERTGFRPLLLLDDVFSELDEERRHGLVRRLRAGMQAIITTTDLDHVDPELQDEAHFFRVRPGKVEPYVAAARRAH